MKFTISLNFENGETIDDIDVEADNANYALDKTLANLTHTEVDNISSFVIVGVSD